MARMKLSLQICRSSATSATLNVTTAIRWGTTKRTVGPRGETKKVSVLLDKAIMTTVPTTAAIETEITADQTMAETIAIVTIAAKTPTRPTLLTLKLGPLLKNLKSTSQIFRPCTLQNSPLISPKWRSSYMIQEPHGTCPLSDIVSEITNPFLPALLWPLTKEPFMP